MADSGTTTVNTTPNYNPNTTNTPTLSVENKTYYERLLIETAEAELIHDQFGQERTVPPNNGKTVEFRQFDPLPEVTTPLTEGVTPDGQTMSAKAITATLKQYGAYVTISDMLDMTGIDKNIVEATKAIGSQGGRSADTITREIINAGTNVMYGGGKSSRADIGYTSESVNCNMTVDLIKRGVRFLKKQNAPKIDGYYIMIVHPDVSYDIMKDKDWKDPNTYKDQVDHIFTGEIGCLYGVRFVENSRAKVFEKEGATGTGTGAPKQDVYSSLLIAENAYGVIPLQGAGMEHIVKPRGSAGSADPLNQRSTVGWKCCKTAAILVQQYMLRFETSATP